MKSILRIFILTIYGLTSCINNQTNSESEPISDIKTEVVKNNDFLKRYEEPSQTFKVLSDKPTRVTGKQGTIISINPYDLVTENGQTIGKNIEVELKELTNQTQLVRNNVQTTSDGQLLVSGGAYFINLTSDGQQLKLKAGKKLWVEFPKLTSKEMYLFYGQRDTLGQLNWQQAEEMFENKPKQKVKIVVKADTSTSEIDAILGYIENESNRPLTPQEKKVLEKQKKNEALANKVYKAIELKKFGWINCDRFYEVSNKTNLQYSFSDKDSIVSANVYLVFKDINSVMQNVYFSFDSKEFNSGFEDVPVGAKTQLIAFSVKNGKAYTYKSNLVTKVNETINLTLSETTEAQLNELFQVN
jgi:hypothetical protein